MCCIVKLVTIFFICLSVFFYLIKLRRSYWILTEMNKTFTWKLGGKKYLEESFIHACANLHSIHTNKQEDANVKAHALGSTLTEIKRTSGFCEKKTAHEGFL